MSVNNNLIVACIDDQITKKIKPDVVVAEEEFSSSIEDIIVRDFFPDLPKISYETEYIEAVESNDVDKIRELELRKLKKIASDSIATDGAAETADTSDMKLMPPPSSNKVKPLSLDKYLANYTSEDNKSFEELIYESEAKKALRNSWLLEQPDIENSGDIKAIESGTGIKTWKYSPYNSLMYVPKGSPLTDDERYERRRQREIVHENTRFSEGRPRFNARQLQQQIAQLAHSSLSRPGHIGIDGHEVSTSTPRVGGYSFCATPSPAPGVIDESPLMTWGEVEGTPLRLDTPSANVRPYSISYPSRRDELGIKLADEISKQHRAKKEQALRRVSALTPGSPYSFGTASKTDRLSMLSPAAQRLVSSKLRVSTDKSLKSSYTPTHSLRTGSKTPGSSRLSTPRIDTTPRNVNDNLTDNLLKLTKK